MGPECYKKITVFHQIYMIYEKETSRKEAGSNPDGVIGIFH
jgi:hypothetical protein